MSVRSAQPVTVAFVTTRFDTGAAANADSLPAGVLYVNGTADAAVVTVTNITTGLYKAAVTLPALSAGDVVEVVIAATVNSVAGKAVVWRDTRDITLSSSGGVGMAVTRSTGALLGTDESTGVSLDVGASSAGSQADLLADNTSRGEISLYVVFTTPSAAPTKGGLVVTYEDERVSGQRYPSPDSPARRWDVPLGAVPASTTKKVFLGRLPTGRYGLAVALNTSDVALSNVAILYALEKEG